MWYWDAPMGLGCGLHLHILLFGYGQWQVCVVLVAADVFPGPAVWCVVGGSPCGLDEARVFC